jgi:hypothetical protein
LLLYLTPLPSLLNVLLAVSFLYAVVAAGTRAEFIGDLALSSQPKKSWSVTRT